MAFQNGVAGETYHWLRMRDANSTTTNGIAVGSIFANGRVKRILWGYEVDPSADHVADIILPGGTVTGALNLANHGGHASVGANQSLELILGEDEPIYEVKFGDVIRIDNTTGSGAAGSAYITVVVG